ncbi:MAG: MerR family transcriptional regulator [Candidatus Muiribacteriota bacterium]
MTEYDIKQVSEITDISIDTVHHYVKKFRKYFKGLKRGKFNSLVFSDCDIEFLITIRTLNKMENLTLKEIKHKLDKGEINPAEVSKNSKVEVENESETKKEIYAIEKIEEFEKMFEVIRSDYGKISEDNQVISQRTEDLKNMLNTIYSKLNHIELKQQKLIEEVNSNFWSKIKGFMLKPVRIPFLWKL